jgi:hypothetical protein
MAMSMENLPSIFLTWINAFESPRYCLVALQHMQESAAGMPSSTEDTGWLAKSDASLAAAIKALRPESIILTLERSMLQFQDLDSREVLVATALFRMALPIVQQYRNILFDVVIRYAKPIDRSVG